MPSVKSSVLRNLDDSFFPLDAIWESQNSVWHESYPDHVPPGITYPSLRTEQMLLCAAGQCPDRIAIRYFDASWTYRELVEQVKQVAANLQKQGVTVGDRVMMVLPNCPEFIFVWFALHWIGAEVVPGNPLLSAGELTQLAEQTQCRIVLGLDLRLDPVIEMTHRCPIDRVIVVSLSPHLPYYLRWPYRLKLKLSRQPRPAQSTKIESVQSLFEKSVKPLDNPLLTDTNLTAVLQPTGGTTGTPKVAMLTHQNLTANVFQLHVWSGLQAGHEVVLSVLPFFHVFGSTVAMLSPLAGGATLIIQAKFDASRILKVMQKWKPTVASMVPFMFAELCDEMKRRGKSIEGLNFCMSGAAPLSEEISNEFQRLTGVPALEGYGLSEASPVTHSNPPNKTATPGTIGLPLPNTEIRIVDIETGHMQVRPGEVGELVIRGPQVMVGYLDNPEETSMALRDGWLHTGDLASMDENGFFTIVDRKKDMIISGGLNIYPSEVEEVIAAHSTVDQCAVVGAPDDKYGERLVAYVVPAAGKTISPAILQKHCAADLARYKIPKTFEICDELPTNFLGKVRRIDLRSRAA